MKKKKKETTISTRATAYWASQTGIGRSARPPSPWASTLMTPGARPLQAGLLQFHLEHAGRVGSDLEHRRPAGLEVDLAVVAVEMNLVGPVGGHLEPDLGPHLTLTRRLAVWTWFR
jgi:hypothetical protein